MDFALTEEQEAATGLARQILDGVCTLEHLTDVESAPQRFDRELWGELGRAGLLGLCLPEEHGGGGLGFLDACLLLVEHGRSVASIPLWPSLVAGLTLADAPTSPVVPRWLPRLATGDAVVTLALVETAAPLRFPAVTAVRDGDSVVLDGAKTTVPWAGVADLALVTVALDGEPAVVAVELDGAAAERQETFNLQPDARLDLDGIEIPRDAVLATGAEAVGRLVDRATVALCAVAAGVADRGTRLTADYASERHQFGRPIATFQAVGQRMADAFIDAEAIRLTMLQAASLLDAGREADEEVAIAKYWASVGGSRVGHAGLHVHGGISIDLDYPIHRYFLWSKQLEFTLGAGTEQLARLGTFLADRSAAG